MNLSDFDYHLPVELIAQTPTKPRDHSRLFVYNRLQDKISHKHFYDIISYLKPGDVLVLNNTKVFPARLIGKKETGGRVEVFLLKQTGNIWQVLIGGKTKCDTKIRVSASLYCTVLKKNTDNTWEVKFNLLGKAFWQAVYTIGEAPTPPYIKPISNLKEYQTVFAKKQGSVAAPTAGFHFSQKLITKLKKQGITILYITLHVGLGTFEPVKVERITQHVMHAEWGEINLTTAKKINQAIKDNRRIISVGTTSTRTLEAFAYARGNKHYIKSGNKWITTFIYPGYKFKIVNALITNFHLPKSTLIMLVAAFLSQKTNKISGIKKIHELYQIAIKKKYRFYSFGDGMFIL